MRNFDTAKFIYLNRTEDGFAHTIARRRSTTLALFAHNLANQKIEFSYLTRSRLRVPRQQQQQQQYLLAFPWIAGIADYNIDYVKVKGKKKRQ